MNALVTGASGFIGTHVVRALDRAGINVVPVIRGTTAEDFTLAVNAADVVVHLAGVNRAKTDDDFAAGNREFTAALCSQLRARSAPIRFLFSSSIQAGSPTAYGRSKQDAEKIVESFANDSGSEATIWRLPNVYGPGGRANYNSVVATFCHNIARGLPIQIEDPGRHLPLIYVEEVASAVVDWAQRQRRAGCSIETPSPTTEITVGELAQGIRRLRDIRDTLLLPDLSSPFSRQLYATYVSYLAPDVLAYDLVQRSDPRGTLAEFMKTPWAGQIFVSRTVPGVTRGNHFHETKAEKFFVLDGDGIVRFRAVGGTAVTTYPVRGTDFRVIDIPPGYAHSIENVGERDLIVLFWSTEPFDPHRPDTSPATVIEAL